MPARPRALSWGEMTTARCVWTATIFALSLSGCSLLNEPVNRADGDAGVGSGDRDMTHSGSGDMDPGGSASCTVLPQRGCGSGLKCTLACNPTDTTFEICGPGPNNTTTCAANGTKQVGAVCNPAPDNCAASSICIPDYSLGSSTANMICRQFCASDNDCTQPAQTGGAANKPHCTIDVASTGLKVCTVACNPVTAAGPSGCPTYWYCDVFSTATLSEATDCEYNFGNGTPEGYGCNSNSDCGNGHSCVDNGTTKKCRQNCRAGHPGDCSEVAGATCQLPTGAVLFGVCCPSGGC